MTPMISSRPAKALAGSLAALGFASSLLAGAPPVDLGNAGNFTILAKTGISAASAPPTFITGNMGISPAAASFITGFPLVADPSNQFDTAAGVNGKIYAADFAAPTPALMTAAISDMQTAYTDAAGRPADVTELGAGTIGGLTLVPGVYRWTTAVSIPTDLTLAGDANGVWIFQVGGTLELASATHIILSGGAQAKNIFWQVSGQAQLDANSVFNGSILDQTNIAMITGATMNGKALAQTAVTMQSNTVISSASGYAGPNPPDQGQIFAFPSPAHGNLINIVYDMTSSGRARVQIWNENGDLVATQEDQKLAGPQRTQLSIATFASGVYIYRAVLTYDNGTVETLGVQKFAVSK